MKTLRVHQMIISNVFNKQIKELNFSGHNDDFKKTPLFLF